MPIEDAKDAVATFASRFRRYSPGLHEFADAVAQRRPRLAAAVLDRKVGKSGAFEVYFVNENIEFTPASLDFRQGKTCIGVVRGGDPKVVKHLSTQLYLSIEFISFCSQVANGTIDFYPGDFPHGAGIANSSNRSDSVLVPDFCYVSHQGYAHLREYFSSNCIPWEDRIRTIFWRGTTTGLIQGDWRGLPRVALCREAAKNPPLFDVGFTQVVQIADPAAETELRRLGMMKPFSPPETFQNFRYHIDVDGNANAFSGLFFKLLSGSPVLKVASPRNYRQWFYERLIPFENFVPVRADLSDLHEKARWLLDHDDDARRIGEAGRALAMSMTYEAEIEEGRNRVLAALERVRERAPAC